MSLKFKRKQNCCYGFFLIIIFIQALHTVVRYKNIRISLSNCVLLTLPEVPGIHSGQLKKSCLYRDRNEETPNPVGLSRVGWL